MSLSRLSLQEMLSVVGRWIQADSSAYQLIVSNGVLRGFVARIEWVHTHLLAVREAHSSQNAALAEAVAEADSEHDFWVYSITSTCDVVGPTDPTLHLADIREWLFPLGVMHARDVYGTEVAYAAQKEAEMDAARRAQLQTVVLGKQTLLQWVENYFAAARKLAEFDSKRAASADAFSDKEAVQARRDWVHLVKAFESAAKVADLRDEDYFLLFGFLNDLNRRRPVRTTEVAGSDEETLTAGELPTAAQISASRT